MGTHPIFESDFDCLTETRIQNYHHVGSQDPEEAYLQEVHLPWCRLGPAPRHEIGEPHRAPRLPPAPSLQPWHQAPRGELPQAPPQGQESYDRRDRGETSLRQDSSPQRCCHPRNGWLHHRYLQRQSFQPDRGQARDDQPLHWRVLHDLQASSSRSPRYWCHSLFSIHPTQISWERRLCSFCVLCSFSENKHESHKK